MKKSLFSKFKDYNYILDKVLEDKNFSEDAKNLLLNMIYKIETSYKDYAQIKGIFQKQKDFIDRIIEIVSDRCKYLFLVDPKFEEVQALKRDNVLALTDEREQRIYAYPTELAILYGIIDINPKYFYIPRKYYYLKNQLQRILVQGTILNDTEVIRNFNGWSWNVSEDINIDYVSNMIYQSIRMLIDEDFLRMWEQDTSAKVDFVNEMKKELEEYYGTENSRNFYIALAKLVLASSTNEEKERLKAELKKVVDAYENMKDKTEYIKRVSEEKKRLMSEIEQKDILLNDDKKLVYEFKRRNAVLADDMKILTIRSLTEIIQAERDKCVNRIEEINELVKPSNYTQLKNELAEKMQIMAVVREKKSIRDYSIAFLKESMRCFTANINKISSKEEIFDILYKMRYFRKIRVTKNEMIENIPTLFNDVNKFLKYAITLGCRNKVFNIFCNDVDGNFDIIEVALDTAIPNYEDIDIAVKFNEGLLEITIYDNEVVDKKQVIDFAYPAKDIAVKQGRPVPMYVI